MPSYDLLAPRRVGSSDLLVRPVGLGAGTIGSPGVETKDAIEVVETAWQAGVRLFDTAPWYGVGRSERRLGVALDKFALERDEFAVNTKVGKGLVPEPHRKEENKTYCTDGSVRTPRDPRSGLRIQFDYPYEGIHAQHHASRQRLRLSRVDTLTIHDIDYGYHSEEQMATVFEQFDRNKGNGAGALEELRASGQIRAIGCGCNLEARNARSWDTPAHEDLIDRLLEAVDLDFLIVAGGYTLLETRACRRILPACAKKNVGVICATPFAGGWLMQGATYMYGETPTEIQTKTEKIATICRKFNVPLGAAALQFQLAHPLVAATIPGAKSSTEVRMNWNLAQHDIPSDLWTALKHDELIPIDAPIP